MSLKSHLSSEQKKWLNSKLFSEFRKDEEEFDFLDDYLYTIIKDFSTLLIEGKTYASCICGMGHILVVKRDERSQPFEYQVFFTNSYPLDRNHEYIHDFISVTSTLEMIRYNRLIVNDAPDFFPEFKADPGLI